MRLYSWLAAFQWRLLNSTSRWNRPRYSSLRRLKNVGSSSAIIESLESRRMLSGTTITVTSTADSGTGSLREAIVTANGTADPAAVTINFNLAASGVSSTINLQGPLPGISHTVIIDGTSEPGYPAAVAPAPTSIPLVNLNGASAGNFAGFFVEAGNSTFKGLGFKNFQQPAIALIGDGTTATSGNTISGNVIEQCQVGGIQAFNSLSTTISNNIVSGNGGQGISVSNSNSSLITGNFVGTDKSGTVKEANTLQGILVSASSNVTVSSNLVSGNGDAGIIVQLGGAPTASGMLVTGNIIGTDVTETIALGNGDNGIDLNGGITASTVQNNLVSGNTGIGILLDTSNQNTIQDNVVGTDRSGAHALGNKKAGVLLFDSSNNQIRQNLVSANGFDGIDPDGQGWSGISLQGTNSSGNTVTSNDIGTDELGTAALGNDSDGISIMSGAHDNTIGGVNAGNVISGNRANGITIGDPSDSIPATLTKNNLVLGNFIGTNVSGTGAVANSQGGVEILNSQGNVIGDSSGQLFSGTSLDLTGNLISGNVSDGVSIANTSGVDVSSNKIQANFIGTNVAGTGAIGNGGDGIHLDDVINATIGGSAALRNLIAGNALDEILINNSFSNQVTDNNVGGGLSGTIVDPAGHSGINLTASPDTRIVGNTISFCATAGIQRTNSAVNLVSQNSIFNNYQDGSLLSNAGGIEGVDSNAGVPVINLAYTAGANTHIVGQLTGARANAPFTIEAFSDNASTASAAEGRTFIGSVTGTTDATGSASFEVVTATPVAAGQFLRVTSTVSNSGAFDSSQFSVNPQSPVVINQAPQGTSKTVTFAEDSTYAIQTADFGFTDPNNSPANSFLAVKITTLPTVGTLMDGTTVVTLNQVISAADVASGKLKFTSASQAFATAYGNLQFQVQDNGGTAALGVNVGVDTDPTPKTLTFNVTQNKLTMVASPSPASAGQSVTITVSIKDSFNNLYTSSNSTVTLTLASGTFDDGTTTKARLATSGVATFSNLSFAVAGTYSLKATDGNYTTATANLVVNPAAASKVVITQAPTTGTAGAPLGILIAKIEDAFGNVVTSNTSAVTLSLATFPAGATFDPASTLTVNAVAGVATFNDFELTTAGAYTIKAADGALTSATTNTLTISPDIAFKIVITQAPTTGVSGTVLGTLTAKIQDFFGNVVTTDVSAVTLSLATSPAGAAFAAGSTLVANAVAGIATFSNLKLITAGSYTIKATDGTFSNTTTTPLIISPPAASKVVVTQAPTTGVAGTTLGTLIVKIEDSLGNIVTTDTSQVTLSLATLPVGATFAVGSTLTVNAVAGVATFSNLKLNMAGAYTIKATDGSLTFATTSPLTINPAAASKIAITQAPTTGVAGAVLGTLIAKVEDAFNNVVSTNLSLVTLKLTRSLVVTTVTANVVNGVATFSTLKLNTAGSYTITATYGSATASAANALTISPAAASKVVFTQASTAGTAGVILGALMVKVEDAFGNVITNNTAAVTLSLAAQPTGATFATGSTLTVNSVAGVATFSNIKFNIFGVYTIKATQGSLATATTDRLTISPAAANKVVITQAPTTGVAGIALGTLLAKIEDAFGNVVTTNTSQVTLSLAAFPAGATFAAGSTLIANAVAGVATFSNLKLNTTGAYTIKATDGLLTSFTTNTLTISPVAASKVVITQAPTTGIAGGLLTTLIAKIEDAFGNVVTTDVSPVTLSLAPFAAGPFATGSTLTMNAAAGVATFSNLKLNIAGSYIIKATDGLLTPFSTNSLRISPAAASKVVITQAPTTGTAGSAIGALIVKVEDAFGNVNTTNVSPVTVSLAAQPAGATFATGSTLTVNAVAGVATFTNLKFNTYGVYSIKAAQGTLATATSDRLAISTAAASKVVVTQAPTTGVAGTVLGTALIAQIEDAFGNVIANNTSPVTLSLSAAPMGATFAAGSTLTANPVAGIATFSNIKFNASGVYTINVSQGSLIVDTTDRLTINPGSAAKIALLSVPVGVDLGSSFPAVTIAVQDSFGNSVSAVSNVTLTLTSGKFSNGQSTATVATNGGVATFSSLSVNALGRYDVTVSDGALPHVSFSFSANAQFTSFGTGLSSVDSLLTTNHRRIYQTGSQHPADLKLWSVDNVAAGTPVLLMDFGSTASDLTVVADPGAIIFSVRVNATSIQLWSTDGTTAGTVMLSTFGPDAVNVAEIQNFNGFELFTVTNTKTQDVKLLSIQGTAQTTTLHDFGTTAEVTSLQDANGIKFFQVSNTTTGDIQLWGTAGSAAAAISLHDFGTAFDVVDHFVSNNRQLLILKNKTTTDVQLWGSDGTARGTTLLHDFGERTNITIDTQLRNVQLLQVDNSQSHQSQIWGTDGTAAGTRMLIDFGTSGYLVIGSDAGFEYFDKRTPTGSTVNHQLWVTDGTPAGSVMLQNFHTVDVGIVFQGDANGKALFEFDKPQQVVELWTSNGTVAGTILLHQFTSNADFISPGSIHGVELFLVRNGTTSQLWGTDGSVAGTVLLSDFGGLADFTSQPTLNGLSLFTLSFSSGASQLWSTNGSTTGTLRLFDTGPGGFSLTDVGNVRGYELFRIDNATTGDVALLKTLGTLATSSPLHDFGSSVTVDFDSVVVGLFVVKNVTDGKTQLWGTNANLTDIVLLHDFNANLDLTYLGTNNGISLFDVNTPFGSLPDHQLWGTNGLPTGTVLLHDFQTADIEVAAAVNGTVIIQAIGVSGNNMTIQLWGTNGTTAGTGLQKNFGTLASGSRLTLIDTFDSFALFSLLNATSSAIQLWEIG